MSKAKIPEHEQFEIVAHIRDAKDKRKQLQIEADLYCISVMQVKEILKAHGFNLRKLNGANLMKKAEPKEGIPVGIGDDNKGEAWTPAVDEKSEQVETEVEQAKQWAEIAIPPVENIITDVQDIPKKEIKYKKPEIIEPPVAKKDDKLSQEDLLSIHASQHSPVFREFMQSYIELRQRRRIIIKELREIDYAVKECEDLMNGKLNWADVLKQEDKEDKEMWEYET